MIYRPARQTLNTGWRFRFQTDNDWQTVNLPHTWNALDTMSTDPDWHYRRGVGTYEREIPALQASDAAHRWLEFEAVAQVGRVYFDDDLLTTHYGGYTSFTVKIPNRAGTLRVEADNTPDIDVIPSDRSDFFLYGGITRNVWLYTTEDTYLESLICEADATPERGLLRLRGEIAGAPQSEMQLRISVEALNRPAVIAPFDVTLQSPEFDITLPHITGDNYYLWSPNRPNRYQVQIDLFINGHLLDAVTEITGFRFFDFPAYDGFYLNGERLLLRGTHRHEDYAGHGGAVPDDITRREFQMIREAGFNFVRLGHYPQSRAALEACDELGLIVWEELPWCRGGVGGDLFKQHTRAMLHEMLTQHRNHPSIIFWGLGNELDWESDHPGSTDDKVRDFLQELHDTTHELDPTRLTAIRRFDYGADVIDVYSPSIWAGWYRGNYTDYEHNLRDALQMYPRLLHMEWGGDSHAGRYAQPPHINGEVQSTADNAEETGTAISSEGFTRYSKDGDWSESYILDLFEHHLRVQENMPNFAGGAQWVFKDFGTPLRPDNPVPYVNQKGVIERDGTAKNAFYLFKTVQNRYTPQIYFEDVSRCAADEEQVLRVITNCDRIDLWLNGELHSTHQRGAAYIIKVPLTLKPGQHTLQATGSINDNEVSHRQTIVAVEIGQVATDFLSEIQSTTDGTRTLCLYLVDDSGRYVLDNERRVRFTAVSGGILLRHQGHMRGSEVVETASGIAMIEAHVDNNKILTVQVAVDDIGTQEIEIS